MTDTSIGPQSLDIVVDEVFPHSPEAIWRALTTGSLMARWLMEPQGFEPVEGNRFSYQTTPAGKWNGTISCEVRSVIPNRHLSYSWVGGDESNLGYGSRLETIVTFELEEVKDGTRLRLTHAGFQMPRNETAYHKMSTGWQGVVKKIGTLAGEAA